MCCFGLLLWYFTYEYVKCGFGWFVPWIVLKMLRISNLTTPFASRPPASLVAAKHVVSHGVLAYIANHVLSCYDAKKVASGLWEEDKKLNHHYSEGDDWKACALQQHTDDWSCMDLWWSSFLLYYLLFLLFIISPHNAFSSVSYWEQSFLYAENNCGCKCCACFWWDKLIILLSFNITN